MTEFIGAASRLSFARESTYGELPAAFNGSNGSTAQRFIGITNSSVQPPDPTWEIRQYRSVGQGRNGYFNQMAGKAMLQDSLSFLPTSGEFLYYGTGKETFTNGSPKLHTLDPVAGALMPSFTLGAQYEGDPNFTRLYTGCVVNRLGLSLSAGEELQAQADYMAKRVFPSADDSVTAFPNTGEGTPEPYMFYDVGANVVLDGTSYDFTTGSFAGGRSIARVERFSASITHSLRTKHYIQSGLAQYPFNHLTAYPDYDLSIDVVPAGASEGDGGEDQLYDLLVNYTTFKPKKMQYVVIPFQRTGPEGVERLDLVFKDCFLSDEPHPIPGDGGEVKVSMKLKPRSFSIRVSDANNAYASA